MTLNWCPLKQVHTLHSDPQSHRNLWVSDRTARQLCPLPPTALPFCAHVAYQNPGHLVWVYQCRLNPGSPKHFNSVQSLSRVRLCDPMNCNTPGLPVHHQLPEFTQTHVHWVGDAIQPSYRLLSPSPPAPNLSQHQGLFQWVSSSRFTQTLRKACASGLVSLCLLSALTSLWFLEACQVLPLELVKNELLYFISSCDLLLNLGLPPSSLCST